MLVWHLKWHRNIQNLNVNIKGIQIQFPLSILSWCRHHRLCKIIKSLVCYNLNQIIMLYLNNKNFTRKFPHWFIRIFSYIHPEIKSYITPKKTNCRIPLITIMPLVLRVSFHARYTVIITFHQQIYQTKTWMLFYTFHETAKRKKCNRDLVYSLIYSHNS